MRAARVDHQRQLRLRHVPARVAADAHRLAGGPRTRCGVALKNSSGRAALVDAVVEIAAAGRLRLLHPRGAAAEVGDAGRPHLLRADRRAQRRGREARALAVRRILEHAREQRRRIVARDDLVPARRLRPEPAAFALDDDAGCRSIQFHMRDHAGIEVVHRMVGAPDQVADSVPSGSRAASASVLEIHRLRSRCRNRSPRGPARACPSTIPSTRRTARGTRRRPTAGSPSPAPPRSGSGTRRRTSATACRSRPTARTRCRWQSRSRRSRFAPAARRARGRRSPPAPRASPARTSVEHGRRREVAAGVRAVARAARRRQASRAPSLLPMPT